MQRAPHFSIKARLFGAVPIVSVAIRCRLVGIMTKSAYRADLGVVGSKPPPSR